MSGNWGEGFATASSLWLFVLALAGVVSIAVPTREQRAHRRAVRSRNRVLREALAAGDAEAVARIRRPWLFEGSMGAVSLSDPMRDTALEAAWREIDEYQQTGRFRPEIGARAA